MSEVYGITADGIVFESTPTYNEFGQEVALLNLGNSFNNTVASNESSHDPSFLSISQQGDIIDSAVKTFDKAYVDYLNTSNYRPLLATYTQQASIIGAAHVDAYDQETMNNSFEMSVRYCLKDVLQDPNIQESITADVATMAEELTLRITELQTQLDVISNLEIHSISLYDGNPTLERMLNITEEEIEMHMQQIESLLPEAYKQQEIYEDKLEEVAALFQKIDQYETVLDKHIITPEQENSLIDLESDYQDIRHLTEAESILAGANPDFANAIIYDSPKPMLSPLGF